MHTNAEGEVVRQIQKHRCLLLGSYCHMKDKIFFVCLFLFFVLNSGGDRMF